MIRAQFVALLESDFYFYSTDSNLYRPLWATSGRRAVTRRDAHASKICSLVYTHARTYASRFQIEGLARGYLSVTRWQAYAPLDTAAAAAVASRWGMARHRPRGVQEARGE